MCGFRFIAGLEREGNKWPAANADDVEAVKERTYYAVYCGIDFAEIVNVHCLGSVAYHFPLDGLPHSSSRYQLGEVGVIDRMDKIGELLRR